MADMDLPAATTRPSTEASSPIDALRERGAQRIDPVRFHLTESLLRRSRAYAGPARRVLDAKVAILLQALSDQVSRAESTPVEALTTAEFAPLGCGALAGLVGHIAQQKPRALSALEATALKGVAAGRDSPVDPKTLQFFRRTWSRLSSDQRLAQSRSSLPDNAGPLNSHHLVHRSLNVMRELSPEYFDLFISHVDALLWLERANEQAVKGSKKAAAVKRG